MNNVARPLGDTQIVDLFLRKTLQFNYGKDPILQKIYAAKPGLKDIVSMIVDGELGVSSFDLDKQTFADKRMRTPKYSGDDERWELREQIIKELFTLKRLPSDDDIKLGEGGALPNAPVVPGRQAFILIGLPASGKSSIACDIAEANGAVIIDSDFAKRKLPEFNNHFYGATIVHEESSCIATKGFQVDNPGNLKSLYTLCLDQEYNIVLPKIGQDPQDIIALANALINDRQYEVHLILVSLPKREATIRAIYRYAESNRYVPLGLIFDFYGNDPSHCYYYLRTRFPDLFKSFGVVSTIELPNVHTDFKDDSSPVLKYPFKDVILQLP